MLKNILTLSILVLFSLEGHAQLSCKNLLAEHIPVGASLKGRTVRLNISGKITSFETGSFHKEIGNASWLDVTEAQLSPDSKSVAVLIRARSEYGNFFSKLVFYDLDGVRTGSLSLDGGRDFVWPASNPNIIIAPFYEVHYISDWGLDYRFDQNKVTYGSNIIDIKTGETIEVVPHNLGWQRYTQLPWPSNKNYAPDFEIVWSKKGNFYADISGDDVIIYEFDLKTMTADKVKTSSLKTLKTKLSQTLGLFSDDVSKFERELAEIKIKEGL